jgi:adenylate cyclase
LADIWKASDHMAEKRTHRRLAAILAADVVGYARLMEADEGRTLAQLKALRKEVFDIKLADHNGRIVKTMGDGVLVEFASAVDAVQHAVEVQRTQAERNRNQGAERRIELRIGINVGDIIVEGSDLYGDGVNIAARLETLAEPGGIYISGTVFDQVGKKLGFGYDDLGLLEIKNISEPLRCYRVKLDDIAPARPGAPAAPGAPGAVTETAEPLRLPDKPSIAVLPFDNMSGDPAQEFLADGVVEAITAALSCIRSFFVIARNSAFTFKNRVANAIDIGKELGVGYILEGSVQKASDRVRITVQLIETQAGAHIWAEHYDGTIDDIFDLHDRITERVAGQLQPSIRMAEIERARRKRPRDQGAYDFTMRAMPHVWALEKEESARALTLLDDALAIDPGYPLALSLAGWCHAQRSVYNWSEEVGDSQARAFELAEKAAELSSDDPLILAVLGAVHTFVRNFGTARILLERAVALDPNAAWAWHRLGWLDNYADRPERALEHFERALRLSPLDPINFNNYVGMASAHEVAQNYDMAATLYWRGLEERPQAKWIYRSLAPTLYAAGRVEEAEQAFAVMMETYPDLTTSKIRQAMVFSDDVLDRMVANLGKLGMPQ